MRLVARRKQQGVDMDTGEVLNVVALVPQHKDWDVAQVCELFATQVLEQLGLINGEGRLLLWFLAKTVTQPTQGEGWVQLDRDEVTRTLGIGRSTLRRYLHRLRRLGYVESDPKSRGYLWRIRSDMVYRGSLKPYWTKKLLEATEPEACRGRMEVVHAAREPSRAEANEG